MKRFLRHAAALGVTSLVNVAMLGLFLRLNDLADHPREQAGGGATVVEFSPPPPKRHSRPRPPRSRPQVQRSAPKVLNLPSAMQAPELLDLDMGGVDMLSDLAGDELASSTGLVMAQDEVDEPPQVVSNPPPTYPSRALDREQEGVVELRLLVDENGVVRKVQVLDADPPGVFEQAATDAVWRWRYRAAVYQGRQVRCWYRQRVVFRLH